MKYSSVLFLLLFIQVNAQRVKLLPEPVSIAEKNGSFLFSPAVSIKAEENNKEAMAVVNLFVKELKEATGIQLTVNSKNKSSNSIIISIASLQQTGSREAYILDISPSGILIKASSGAGLFYAFQTIKQLLPPSYYAKEKTSAFKWSIPCAVILDYPRYNYRGMHLDVSRHFYPAAFIKAFIDILAAYKLNVFHWHLTDSHGWRIEIKKYPKLTSVGAWRADRKGIPMTIATPTQPGEKTGYGGFYTQEEIKDIVHYAAQRFITIIPEIEMPGHCTAALVAYPQYACLNNKVPLLIPCGYAGDLKHNFCVGYDSTFIFLEDILKEVMTLFPSRYIHIGGDEVRPGPWLNCPRCRKRMQDENLSTGKQLQAWFTKRIDSFLVASGRNSTGWEEMLWANVAPQSAGMVWHAPDGAVPNIKRGYDVIMTPYHYTYFDFYQSDPALEPDIVYAGLGLDTAYAFNPMPAGLTADEQKHVLGGQACLWTENIETAQRVEYMLLPRLLALSESVWSPPEKKNYREFIDRTELQFPRFTAQHISYAKSLYNVSIRPAFDTLTYKIIVSIYEQAAGKYTVRYTTDGSLPSVSSTEYKGPFVIKQTAHLKAALFDKNVLLGKITEDIIELHEAWGRIPVKTPPAADAGTANSSRRLTDGIYGTIEPYDGRWVILNDSLNSFTIDLQEMKTVHSFGIRFMEDQVGDIYLPANVQFFTSADGTDFKPVYTIVNDTVPAQLLRHIEKYRKDGLNITARYVRVIIQKGKVVNESGNNMIFSDEITVL